MISVDFTEDQARGLCEEIRVLRGATAIGLEQAPLTDKLVRTLQRQLADERETNP